jgi:hypothetical protein
MATPRALGACSHERILACLQRHACGDWGEIDEEDAQANARALVAGARVLSAYPIDERAPAEGENRLWVITEADRSLTTCLPPEEY